MVAVAVAGPARRDRRRRTPRRGRRRSRCTGRTGPVSAACQKLSLPRRDDALHRDADPLPGRRSRPCPRRAPSAGSPSWTVAHSRSGSSFSTLGDELPGVVDGLVLEVVAEREVAHHLEEGAVAVGAPDVVEVGVLAAGAQARLDADDTVARRLLRAQEVRLERLHPGDDEERRGGRPPAGSTSARARAGAPAPRRSAETPRATRWSSSPRGQCTDALWSVCRHP